MHIQTMAAKKTEGAALRELSPDEISKYISEAIPVSGGVLLISLPQDCVPPGHTRQIRAYPHAVRAAVNEFLRTLVPATV